MTVLKQYNTTTSAWEAIVVGAPGPAGGVQNIQGVTGIWTGTQAAYDAIGSKVSTVLYVIAP